VNDLNVIDRFMQAFITYIDAGFGLLGGDVRFLTATLTIAELVPNRSTGVLTMRSTVHNQRGELVLLEAQDRTLWDRAQITTGLALLEQALAHGERNKANLLFLAGLQSRAGNAVKAAQIRDEARQTPN